MPDGLHTGPTPDLPLRPDRLAHWFAQRLGVARVEIGGIKLLSGGAVQHNWRVDLLADNAPASFVLRAGPAVPLPESLSKAEEFAFLRRAHGAGVPVPEPLWLSEGAHSFLVTGHLSGDAAREALIARTDNVALVADLGSTLARIHAVCPDGNADPVSASARVTALEGWVAALDQIPEGLGHELAVGFAWLRANIPATVLPGLVHRDFRTGNFLVEGDRLSAVLDWEFAGWGDPAEDIGWFCAACWRGDAPAREAGGLGSRDAFYDAYIAAGGELPDLRRVRFWEVFAHLRWAVIALQQGARARAGAYPTWELEEAEARVPDLLHTVATMTRAGS